MIERWTRLFKGGVLVQRYKAGQCHSSAEIEKVFELAETWRERLMSISWFIRCLNESIARRANAEDNCTGKFWESRFKSQALLDEQALLACMVYVDLNPIRAGICQNLESSEFTSIAQRINEYANSPPLPKENSTPPHSLKPTFSPTIPIKTHIPLASFVGSSNKRNGIPYTLLDYFELADWTGRAIRDDKRGYIPSYEPKIIHKLGISSETWLETIGNFKDNFHTFIGPEEKMTPICRRQKKRWLLGINICRRLFHHQNPLSL